MLYYLLESPQIFPPPNYSYNIMIYDERKLSYSDEISSSLQSLTKPAQITQNNEEEIGTSPSLQTQPITPDEKPFENQTVPTKVIPTKIVPMANPGITIQTPSGYGKSQGDVSVSVGYQNRTRYGNIQDGVIGFGFGLGDSKNAIGIDLNLGIADVDEWKNGSFSFKIHKQLPEDLALAFGVKNVATFGNPDGGTSVYTVITKMIRVQDTPEKLMDKIYVSVGVGGGQFRTESDINNKKNSVGVFGSVAFQLGEPINAVAEWTGQDLTIGFSLAPFPKIPIVFTPAFTDILGTAGDGQRFILGVGYKLKF